MPGTRWVDLETDRGKPARLSSAVTAAAAAAAAQLQQQQQEEATEAVLSGASSSSISSFDQQWEQDYSRVSVDTTSEQDHLADLTEYPLGSLMSFDEPLPENVPEWIKAFAPAAAAAAAAAATSPVASTLSSSSSSTSTTTELPSQQQVPSLEGPWQDDDPNYKPFCDSMFDKLQPLSSSATTSSSSSYSDPNDRAAREAANQLQLAAWKEAEAYSWSNRGNLTTGLPGSTAPGSQKKPFCESMAAVMAQQPPPSLPIRGRGMGGRSKLSTTLTSPAAVRDDWGQQEKERRVQELLDLEDNIMGTDQQQQQYKPFCEKMFQSLHPEKSPVLPSAQRQQQQQQHGAHQQHGMQQQQHLLSEDEQEQQRRVGSG